MELAPTRSRRSIENELLAALPRKEHTRLLQFLEPVSLPLSKVLYEGGQPLWHVYFVNRGMVSLIFATESGATIETSVVGKEGIVGLPGVLGVRTASTTAVVQIAGEGMRIRVGAVKAEFNRGGALHALVLRYTCALLTQVSQTAVCNRIHRVEQRLCRWLLMTHDRVAPDDIRLTQNYIATMLGTGRPDVSIAAGLLQRAGLIHYARGKIRIFDRQGLEAAACECYRVVKHFG